jgi:outer membrane lipoprotein
MEFPIRMIYFWLRRKLKMKNRSPLFASFLLIFLVSGCAHVISKDLRASSDLSLTLKQVLENPNAYRGKSVIWGGEIIQTVNQQDGTTQIEVFQRPLGWGEEPTNTVASEGRFLIIADKYLDPYLFQAGRKITVAGEIQGEQIKPLGKMDYRYPVLLSKQIYLWANYYYYPYPYPYYFYWPFLGYPYSGWGYGLYYRR